MSRTTFYRIPVDDIKDSDELLVLKVAEIAAEEISLHFLLNVSPDTTEAVL